MLLTTKARYAVMAMVDMALSEEDKPISLSIIAERQGITIKYLEQIFQFLKKASLVKSTKGPGGGYMLALAAHKITVLSILKAVNEDLKFTRCNHDPQGCMSKKGICLTHHLWESMEVLLNSFLSKATLADVCNKKYRYAI